MAVTCREGELRLCKKVGDQAKEEVILDTATAKPEEASSAEKIDEEIQKIINKPNLDAIPKVKLSEEKSRKNPIEFGV